MLRHHNIELFEMYAIMLGYTYTEMAPKWRKYVAIGIAQYNSFKCRLLARSVSSKLIETLPVRTACEAIGVPRAWLPVSGGILRKVTIFVESESHRDNALRRRAEI